MTERRFARASTNKTAPPTRLFRNHVTIDEALTGQGSNWMKLMELASKLGLKLRGDGEIEILAPVPIEAAGPGTIIFAAGAKYAAALRTTTAAAAIVPADLIAEAKCATLESPNPVFDFSRVLGLFFSPYPPPAGIHPTATLSPRPAPR